jgi:hypothetical protein
MLLARKGVDVMVVDRVRLPTEIPHGHFIHRHGPSRLHGWGLPGPRARHGLSGGDVDRVGPRGRAARRRGARDGQRPRRPGPRAGRRWTASCWTPRSNREPLSARDSPCAKRGDARGLPHEPRRSPVPASAARARRAAHGGASRPGRGEPLLPQGRGPDRVTAAPTGAGTAKSLQPATTSSVGRGGSCTSAWDARSAFPTCRTARGARAGGRRDSCRLAVRAEPA